MKNINITKPDEWKNIYKIKFEFSGKNYKTSSCQNIITFDIETSNGFCQSNNDVIKFDHEKYLNNEDYKKHIDEGVPVSLMYVWQVAIEGNRPYVFMGRTWSEFLEFIELLSDEIHRQAFYGITSIDRDAEILFVKSNNKVNVNYTIYIHNLGFEFQHLRNVFDDYFAGTTQKRKASGGNVFARQSRKPMKVSIHYNKCHIYFKDTLCLTQKSLKVWCKDEKLPVQKLDEPEDYYLEVRTPTTPLTDDEIQYSINDVVSMLWGLIKYRDKYGKLSDIPLTQTGEVRLKCRERVSLKNDKWAAHCATLTQHYTPKMFKELCQLFQGGWVHGNKCYIGEVVKNVKCFDFASSYPAVMTTRTYPLGEFEEVDPQYFSDLENQDLNNPTYRWYAKIKVYNIVSKLDNTYWSSSKVAYDEDRPLKKYIVDNGKIFCAQELTTYMTDLDWDTFKKCYNFDRFEVLSLKKSLCGYLPVELILTILEYFKYKTSLKGIDSEESKYVESKQFINSIYGCAVTKIVSDVIEFGADGWLKTPFNDDLFYDTVTKTKPEKTFLAYQHGIWVTAWARHNLFDFITKLDSRVVYCDTDSIKGKFTKKDIQFVDEYNKNIEEIENKVAALLGFDPDYYAPKTSTGKTKRLGIMEREDDCLEFKTLGAKRYVDLTKDGIQCTIAGLPKRAGKEKLKSVDEFKNDTQWTTKESHKLIACYNDDQPHTIWTDRDGNKYESDDKYGICLQPTTFDLSLSAEFELFLNCLQSGKLDKDSDDITQTPAYLFK